MYWIYRTQVYAGHSGNNIAKLVSPTPHTNSQDDCGFGFKSPRQNEPYGVELEFIYQVATQDFRPDNYADDTGFTLYSQQLVEIFQSFHTQYESFPVTMIDEQGNELADLKYQVFHSLEGVLNAMDEKASAWSGNYRAGIARLVLDYGRFEERPILICNNIYLPLMRDDLKQAIRHRGISGFEFLAPERFRSGRHGMRPDYDD